MPLTFLLVFFVIKNKNNNTTCVMYVCAAQLPLLNIVIVGAWRTKKKKEFKNAMIKIIG